jgi:hypothetical protein
MLFDEKHPQYPWLVKQKARWYLNAITQATGVKSRSKGVEFATAEEKFMESKHTKDNSGNWFSMNERTKEIIQSLIIFTRF